MNRQQRRSLERDHKKIQTRMYTWEECLLMMKEAQTRTAKQYDALYILAAVCALNAEPFKFGKKRIAQFADMFFGQIDGLIRGTIDTDMLVETAKELGVNVFHENGKFIVDIDLPKPKAV